MNDKPVPSKLSRYTSKKIGHRNHSSRNSSHCARRSHRQRFPPRTVSIGSTSSNHSIPTQHTSNIVHGVIAVPAGSLTSYTLDLPPGSFNVIVTGSFTASGGSANDIQVFIMDNTNFGNWLNGQQYYALYSSGQTSTGSINTSLPPISYPNIARVAYNLVYSNKFSTVSNKTINTNVNVSYYA